MNRKARRAAAKQAESALSPAAADSPFRATKADDIYAAAISHYRKGEFVQAENLCRLALSRDARHLRSLVLLGDIVQLGGRNKLAVKLLSQALELDRTDAAAHDNIAIAYQALGRIDEAVAHFTHAMALGLRDPEILVKQSAAVTAPLKRLADAWPRQIRLAELLGVQGASTMAQDAMVLALLQSRVVHDLELERLLTAIRRGLLQQAIEGDRQSVDDDSLGFFAPWRSNASSTNMYLRSMKSSGRTFDKSKTVSSSRLPPVRKLLRSIWSSLQATCRCISCRAHRRCFRVHGRTPLNAY